jgi:hypothetical protein
MKINISEQISEARNAFYSNNLDKYYDITFKLSDLVRFLAKAGDVDKSLLIQVILYNQLVKLIETEEHYYSVMSRHDGALEVMGRKIGGWGDYRSDKNNLVFIAHTSTLLGHTEIMLRAIEVAPRSMKVYFLGLSPMSPKLGNELKRLGITSLTPSSDNSSPTALLDWCAHQVRILRAHTAIWLSTPCWVSYVFSRHIAKSQVYWTLKFHSVYPSDADIHIGMGTSKEQSSTVVFNNREWKALNIPLCVPPVSIDESNIGKIKALYNRPILGVLAREEKMQDSAYCDIVARCLHRIPNSTFLFSGRDKPVKLIKKLQLEQVDHKAKFLGWVDVDLYSSIIDVFLEPFPFGGGVASLKAINQGCWFVALKTEHSIYNHYFSQGPDPMFKKIRFVDNSDEYIEAVVEFSNKAIQEVNRKNDDYEVFSKIDAGKLKRLYDIIVNH